MINTGGFLVPPFFKFFGVVVLDKYLVIGSAPYIIGWYRDNGRSVLSKGYRLVAINNSWAIDPDMIYLWIKSTDFLVKGTYIPEYARRRIWENREVYPSIDNPYMYEKRGSGTMILNTLCYLLNRSISFKHKCKVVLSGCDCVYEGEDTHFYDGGSPDPIRYGKEWLQTELLRIQDFYKQEGCQLFNISPSKKTLLPFKKVDLLAI